MSVYNYENNLNLILDALGFRHTVLLENIFECRLNYFCWMPDASVPDKAHASSILASAHQSDVQIPASRGIRQFTMSQERDYRDIFAIHLYIYIYIYIYIY